MSLTYKGRRPHVDKLLSIVRYTLKRISFQNLRLQRLNRRPRWQAKRLLVHALAVRSLRGPCK